VKPEAYQSIIAIILYGLGHKAKLTGAKAEGAKRPELFIFIAEQRIETFGAVKPNTFSTFHLKHQANRRR
jgi:hypothetical protein